MTPFFDVGRRSVPPTPGDEIEQIVDGLTWMIGPVAPGLALGDAHPIEVAAGSTMRVDVRLTNRSTSGLFLRLAPSALISDSGVVWRPPVSVGVSVDADSEANVVMECSVPSTLPAGTYEGTLLAMSVPGGRVPLTVEVS